MKKLIILFLLFTTSAVGQIHNDTILAFVHKNIGKKVGKGVCYELVERAIRSYDPKFSMTRETKDKILIGDVSGLDVVDTSQTLFTGDIITIMGSAIQHIMIIYDIDEDGVIYVAEQNTKDTLRDSVVEINVLDFDQLYVDYGEIKFAFYRAR